MNQNQARQWQHDYIPQKRQQKVIVKVKRSSWLTTGEKVIYTFCFALMIVATYYIVSFSSSIDTLNREQQTLETNISELTTTNQIKMFEIKELSDPARILGIAEENGFKIQDSKVKVIPSTSNK